MSVREEDQVTGEATLLNDPQADPAMETDEAFPPTPLGPDEARDDSGLLRPAEWLMLVIRRQEDGTFLLVRRRAPSDAPGAVDTTTNAGDAEITDAASLAPPTMLSTWPPHADEGLEAGLASIVWAHLGVRLEGAPRLAEMMRPARMGHPYTGGPTMGLLRAVAIEVSGTPEVDALFAGCEALPASEAELALTTDLERAVFCDGLALFAG